MAAATAADMLTTQTTSTRPTVIHGGENFAEWQTSFSSSVAAYGDCGRFDATQPGMIPDGLKEIYRNKRDHSAKKCTGSDGKSSVPSTSLKEDAGNKSAQPILVQGGIKDESKAGTEEKMKKQKVHQATKKPPKEPSSETKVYSSKRDIGNRNAAHKEEEQRSPKDLASGNVQLKACKSKEVKDDEMVKSPLDERECHKSQEDPSPVINTRRRRQTSVNADQEYQPSRRTEIAQTEVVPRFSKRLRKTVAPPANEEPQPPPALKLPKLRVALTRNEFLEDWFKMTGKKYTGKPKRSSIAQLGLGLCTSLACPSSIRYLKNIQ